MARRFFLEVGTKTREYVSVREWNKYIMYGMVIVPGLVQRKLNLIVE